ncbi:MAG: branched-chain amino acid ABC transporter permease [Bacteroidota bacterium]
MVFLDFLKSTVLVGLLEAAPLMIAAIGFTMIYRLNGFLNIGYAENMTVGAYVAVTLNTFLGWNIYVSMIPSVLISGIVSVLTYLILFRPAMRKGMDKTELVILSVGLAFFIRFSLNAGFTNQIFSYVIPKPAYLSFFGMGITSTQLICLGVALIIALVFTLFMYKTNYGMVMRALADNENLAMTSGINPLKVSIIVWFLAGAVGGLAGVFSGVFTWINTLIGFNHVLIIIMIAIVGGIGSVRGALVVGAFVGMITTAVTLVSKPLYGVILLLVIFILILRFRKVRA